MKVFEYTNKGNRDENQDYVVHGSLPDGSGIFVVTDGMGGYSEGAAAARVVGDALLDFIELNFNQYSPIELLKEAVPFANDALMLKRMAMAAKQMGCVVTVLIVSDGNAYLTWLGDSRIYMFRNGQEVYRTEDHSIVNELAKIKTLSASSYEKYASIVTKSIMGDTPVDVAPIRKIEVEEGDVFILCTDGFHKEIDMYKALKYDDSKKTELDSLANDISDNYSFIKVKI
ncbi:serine/threonine-protein phosphatase [Prevotella nigrescens]|jgi:protein serine/threonine phosphatase|uniref:PP2C family protein-serine/threonine phosphatase n=1 Tax=Prevotella nigrescens TaxID=28133 RepID=UPI00352D6CF5